MRGRISSVPIWVGSAWLFSLLSRVSSSRICSQRLQSLSSRLRCFSSAAASTGSAASCLRMMAPSSHSGLLVSALGEGDVVEGSHRSGVASLGRASEVIATRHRSKERRKVGLSAGRLPCSDILIRLGWVGFNRAAAWPEPAARLGNRLWARPDPDQAESGSGAHRADPPFVIFSP